MVKTTIDIPDEIWKKFSVTVLEEHGGRKMNDIIQGLIEDYLTLHNGVICRNCFHTINLTEIQPKGGVKPTSWWTNMTRDISKGPAFKAICPHCKTELMYLMRDVRPILPASNTK